MTCFWIKQILDNGIWLFLLNLLASWVMTLLEVASGKNDVIYDPYFPTMDRVITSDLIFIYLSL